LNANLPFFDRLDGTIDWPPDDQGVHPLTEVLLADFLVVDTTKPFSDSSFLEIERAVLAGRPHTTCGGRPLDDDIVDICTRCWSAASTDRGSATAWTARPSRPPAASRT
jgi:hypothetical protein